MSYKNCKPSIEAQMDFIAEVEELRKEKGYTKNGLSQRAFKNGSSYYYFCNGIRNMTATSMNQIAKALNMNLVICLVDKED